MKTAAALLAAIAVGAPAVSAYPAAKFEAIARVATLADLKEVKRDLKKKSTFDPAAQRISTSGVNAFVPPDFDAGDQRGPCPGLNALANHGYLPHNGVAGMNDIIDATMSVFGMSLDLSTFLAVYGTVFDGNPLSLSPGYSIGGAPPSDVGENILGGLGLLGTPEGLSGSHNKYESDASPTRGDLFLYGNSYEVQVPQFQQYYNYLPEGVSSDDQYQALLPYRIERFNDSITRNDYFLYSPFSGVLVSPAGYSFPKAMMANHSVEFPDGSLTHENLKSFFAITGNNGSFTYSIGHERIPDNWYRRPANDYSIPAFLIDVLDHGLQYPPFLDVGGNVNGPGTFVGLDFGNLTGGAVNAVTLTQGNNLLCVVLRIIQAVQPDFLGSTFSDPTAAAVPLLDELSDLFGQFACPQLNEIDTTQMKAYPGYSKYNGAI